LLSAKFVAVLVAAVYPKKKRAVDQAVIPRSFALARPTQTRGKSRVELSFIRLQAL
jgi:hypothetical protein